MEVRALAIAVKTVFEHIYQTEITERSKYELQARLARIFRDHGLSDLKFHIEMDLLNGQMILIGERLIDDLAISSLLKIIEHIN